MIGPSTFFSPSGFEIGALVVFDGMSVLVETKESTKMPNDLDVPIFNLGDGRIGIVDKRLDLVRHFTKTSHGMNANRENTIDELSLIQRARIVRGLSVPRSPAFTLDPVNAIRIVSGILGGNGSNSVSL
jgi:hypothetical protein